MVIPKDTPLSDCTEVVIHISKTYSYHDNNTDFMGNNRTKYVCWKFFLSSIFFLFNALYSVFVKVE